MNKVPYPRPEPVQRPPLQDAMKLFLSFFLPALSGWATVLILFLFLSQAQTEDRLIGLIWSVLYLPLMMTISLTVQGVWFFLLTCFLFSVSLISPFLRRFRALLSLALGGAVYCLLQVENLEGLYQGLSGRPPESAPILLLQITGAVATGTAAWLTTARLFRSNDAPTKSLKSAPPLQAPSEATQEVQEPHGVIIAETERRVHL